MRRDLLIRGFGVRPVPRAICPLCPRTSGRCSPGCNLRGEAHAPAPCATPVTCRAGAAHLRTASSGHEIALDRGHGLGRAATACPGVPLPCPDTRPDLWDYHGPGTADSRGVVTGRGRGGDDAEKCQRGSALVRRVRLRPAPRPSRSGSGVQVVQHVGAPPGALTLRSREEASGWPPASLVTVMPGPRGGSMASPSRRERWSGCGHPSRSSRRRGVGVHMACAAPARWTVR